MCRFASVLVCVALFFLPSSSASGQGGGQGPGADCAAFGALTTAGLATAMDNAANNVVATPALNAGGGGVGGLFGGQRMWAAIVNRDGELCFYVTNQADPEDVWYGSQAIAKSKAFTANGFSLDFQTLNGSTGFPLSTAQLYTFVQPGHSLFSLNWSNPFEPQCLAPADATTAADGCLDQIAGGLITFGGGVALYSGNNVIGGLGISGDTSCTDHEMAKRTRDNLGLNPPAALGGAFADDISYSGPGESNASPFTHPLCPNTFRNGRFVGNEKNSKGF